MAMPPIQFVRAPHFYQGGNHPQLIVIHSAENPRGPNAAMSVAAYFRDQTDHQNSAHYVVDAEHIIQCVRDLDGAWHTPGFVGGREVNRMSIGIEHAGFASQSRADWLDVYGAKQLELSAQLTALLCRTYNIPAVKLSPEDLKAGKTQGIAGHVDFTRATGSGDHTDPGNGWPWDYYIQRVQSYLGEGNRVAALTHGADEVAREAAEETPAWAMGLAGGVILAGGVYVWGTLHPQSMAGGWVRAFERELAHLKGQLK